MPSHHVYNLALTIPWQITPEALEAMLAIAAEEGMPEDEIKRRMHGPRSLALRDGKLREGSRTMLQRDGVAILSIDGPIYRYADYFTQVSGGVTTDQLARDFQAAIDAPDIGAIMMVIDSPGGEATGIGELSDAIYAARGQKPIAAYVEGFGASAAYRLASAADVVIVDDEAIVGSIGTIMGVPDPTKRPSYRIEFVSRQSPKKRPDPTTDAGRAILQATVDRLTDVFIAKTARNRSITEEQILAIEGGVLVGQDAIDAGLADRLGSEESTFRELAARAQRRRLFPMRAPGLLPITAQQEDRMKLSEIWAGFFNGFQQAGMEIEPETPLAQLEKVAAPLQLPAATTTTAAAAAPEPAEASAEQQARDARLAALEEQLALQREQQLQTLAQSFADRAVRERRAFPAEHGALAALYFQAAQDDDRHPWQAPKEGEAPSRVALLESQIASRPPHSLSAELVAQGAGGVLEGAGGAGQPMAAERRRALLAMTPMGQQLLARERQAKN